MVEVIGAEGGYYSGVGVYLAPLRRIDLAEIFIMCVDDLTRTYITERIPAPRSHGPCGWLFPAVLSGRHQLWLAPDIEGEIDLSRILLPETRFGFVSPLHPFDPSLTWSVRISADPEEGWEGRLALSFYDAVIQRDSRYRAVRLPAAQTAFDLE